MVRLNWTNSAKTDLKEIYEYIALDSKRYARLQINRIRKRVQVLKNQPNLGKVVDEIQEENIKELVEGNYRIVYRVISQNQIDILLVHHGAGDLSRRIKD